METLTIGKLAKLAEVSTDTVRFYERCGLISPVGRSDSNYRLYHREDSARLHFIRRAKRLGFSLKEIKELLALSRDPEATRGDIRKRTEQKMEEIDEKMADLSRMHSALKQLLKTCKGQGSASDCPILRSLTHGDPHLHSNQQQGKSR